MQTPQLTRFDGQKPLEPEVWVLAGAGAGLLLGPALPMLAGPPLPSHHGQAIRSVHLQTPQSTAPATPHEAKWRGSLARSVELTTEAGGSATTSPKPAKTMRRAIMISRTVDSTKTLRARTCKTGSSHRQRDFGDSSFDWSGFKA